MAKVGRIGQVTETEPYNAAEARWPKRGRCVIATSDLNSVVVYQAYRPSIGDWAVRHKRFGGGGWSRERMSWIKPSFLWMMYRSGWGQKPEQQVILAVRVTRSFFDTALSISVSSTFGPQFSDRTAWNAAVETSEVRHQWDPDRCPQGKALARRALQLGLRGRALGEYAEDGIVDITDITGFVRIQRKNLQSQGVAAVHVPRADVYPVKNQRTSENLGMVQPAES